MFDFVGVVRFLSRCPKRHVRIISLRGMPFLEVVPRLRSDSRVQGVRPCVLKLGMVQAPEKLPRSWPTIPNRASVSHISNLFLKKVLQFFRSANYARSMGYAMQDSSLDLEPFCGCVEGSAAWHFGSFGFFSTKMAMCLRRAGLVGPLTQHQCCLRRAVA